jgi:hypothetical protein
MSGAPDADLPHQRLARALLTSGLCGQHLLAHLAAEFPDLSRGDVFAGIALAWSDRETALLAAEAEVRALRRQLIGQDRARAA